MHSPVERLVDAWGYPQLNRKRPMTIVAGVITWNSVVLASDSQETLASGTIYRDLEKVFRVKILGEDRLIGLAGETDYTSLFRERLETAPETSTNSVEDFVRAAMFWTKSEIRKTKCGLSPLKFQKWMDANQPRCTALVGYLSGTQRHLFRINVNQCIIDKIGRGFAAIGSGDEVGEHFLNYNLKPDMKSDVASAMAIYAVEIAKQSNAGCSGDTQCAIIEHVPNWWKKDGSGWTLTAFLPRERIAEITALVREQESAAKKERDAKIGELLRPKDRPSLAQIISERLEKDANETS